MEHGSWWEEGGRGGKGGKGMKMTEGGEKGKGMDIRFAPFHPCDKWDRLHTIVMESG